MNLLHLDSSIQGDSSISRTLSAAVVDRLRQTHPNLQVTYRDLAATPLPHLTLDIFGSAPALDILAEFKAADIVVIGTGLYNFTVPSQLKAWFDRVLIAGETFRYGAAGPEGLAGGKRVIVALSRGAPYGEGTPYAAAEHAESWLRVVLGFIGIVPEFILADGVKLSDESRAAAVAAALDQAARLEPVLLAA